MVSYLNKKLKEEENKLFQNSTKVFIIGEIHPTNLRELAYNSELKEKYSKILEQTANYIEKWQADVIRNVLYNNNEYKRVVFFLEGDSKNDEKLHFIAFLNVYVGSDYLKGKKVEIYFLDDGECNKISKEIDKYYISRNSKNNLEEEKLHLEREKCWKNTIEDKLKDKKNALAITIVGMAHLSKYLSTEQFKKLTLAKIIEHATGIYIEEFDRPVPLNNGGEFVKAFKKYLKSSDCYIELHLPNEEVTLIRCDYI
ncbi:MAG: hypothetical protein QXL82_02095 [Candidatus Aenigmatarchaeota archaeon]